MATFDDLPLDVLFRITQLYTEDVCTTLGNWVYHARRILSISSVWRTVAKDYVCANAFIEDPRAWFDSKLPEEQCNLEVHGNFTASSNILLIEQLGLLRCVKRLRITVNQFENKEYRATFNLLEIAKKAGPHIDNVRPKVLPSYPSANKEMAEMHRRIALKMHMASIFAHWIPNVCHLHVDTESEWYDFDNFISALIYTYLPQIKSFSYAGIPIFPYSINSSAIDELDLKLLSDELIPFPAINTPRLRKLKLNFMNSFEIMPEFRPDSIPRMIPFDSLEYLHIDISNMHVELPELRRELFDARISRLHSLCITSRVLECPDMSRLLANSIETLRLCVYHDVALKICRQGLGSVHRLIIDANLDSFEEYDMPSIKTLNKLFAITQGIQEVHIILSWFYGLADNPKLNWLHLTHLHLATCTHIAKVLYSTTRMPNLVFFDLNIDGDLRDTKGYSLPLLTLNRKHERFSQSKLEMLFILFDLYRKDRDLEARLYSFSQLLPKLRAFEIKL